MSEKLKIAARYLITVLALNLASSVAILIADLHDFRLIVAVAAGMIGGDRVFKLTNRIKALQEDLPEDIRGIR